jgi:palmitoyltransferase ZDHHC13/17
MELKEIDPTVPPSSTERKLPIEEDLMQLARLGEIKAIQKLFDEGKYDANSSDEQGITALHVCSSFLVERGNWKM